MIQITAVDQPMPAELGGFHDMKGFFTGGQWKQSCESLVSFEKKLATAKGFDQKVEKHKEDVKKRFQKLVVLDDNFSGQMLSVSKIDGEAPGETCLYILTDPDGAWKKVQRVTNRCEVILKGMNWFKASGRGPLAGQMVASVGSFLHGCGRDNKRAAQKVGQWNNGSVPGVDRASFVKMKLEQQTGGQGHVATKATFRKVYPYVK